MSGGTTLGSKSFAAFAALLKSRSGLIIGPEKAYLLESRLAPLLARDGLRDLDALAARLRAPDSERLVLEVVEAMTTNETSFFRDAVPFRHVGEAMLPQLHRARPPDARLRLWSAAASSGQEAYSLAMVVAECRPFLGKRVVEILGTDISPAQIARAAEGRYTAFEVARGVSGARLKSWFEPCGGVWRVRDAVRRTVTFEVWNLLENPGPLGRFDLVFLRNVLIYLDQPTKARVLDRVTGTLAEDGALYLGCAETVLGISDRLIATGVAGVFRRRA